MQIFDAHFHIIDDRFPLEENEGYLPPIFDVAAYNETKEKLGIEGGVVVSGSFQAFDQTYLVNALEELGEGFYGVANIPFNMSAFELQKLDDAGVVAVRFNIKRGGSERIKHLISLSNKLFDEFGWHTELYVHSNDLEDLEPSLSQIPQYSIDHLGLSKKGLPSLYRCLENGAMVKATGFGRIDFEVIPVMKKIMTINPNSLMFGTDLPSTRAKMPFSENDLELIKDHFSDEDRHKILYQNGFDWYSKKS